MFETAVFRGQIIENLVLATSEFRLDGYHPAIPDALQFLAQANEEFLLQHERQRPAAERRGLPDALKSLGVLAMSAARNARERHAMVIDIPDLARAYATHFGTLWPFHR